MNFSLTKAINKIHFTYLKYYKLNDRFEDKMKKNGVYYIYIDNKNNKKPVIITDTDDLNKLFVFLQQNKKSFIKIHKYLLKILTTMKHNLEIKTFKKLNITAYKKAIANKNIRQILIEYISIYRIIKYYLYPSYQNNYIYTNIKRVKGQYYYQNALSNKKRSCIDKNCKSDEREEINRKFAIEFHMNIKTIKAMKAFVKTQLFRDYFECIYNECNKEIIAYFRSHLTHHYILESIKDGKKGKKLQYEYNKIRKSLSLRKIKTFDEFLKIVRKYSIFTKKII